MTRQTLLAATVILSAAAAAPAFAQAVISEPGAYAFYHPNGDLGLGSGGPASAMASQPLRNSGGLAQFRSATMSHPIRRVRPASAGRTVRARRRPRCNGLSLRLQAEGSKQNKCE